MRFLHCIPNIMETKRRTHSSSRITKIRVVVATVAALVLAFIVIYIAAWLGSSASAGVTAGCLAALIAIAILILKCFPSLRSRKWAAQQLNAPIEVFLDGVLKEKPIRFTPQNIADFTSNYAERLGSGGFGVVYKGNFPNGTQIAVKVLQKTLEESLEKQFMSEIGTIGRTYHMNLVKLHGFCFEETMKALVFDYMENGSLDQYIHNENCVLDWQKLHGIAIGTAKGIRYLHEECQKRIVHYDIKPANILLDATFCPKVADFGLAKLCDRESSRVGDTGGKGTPGYAAPEMWMPFPVTYKCDVYSFGMLLFEILGRRRNLDVRLSHSKEWFPVWVWQRFEEGEMETIISSFGLDGYDAEMAERMCKVALWCVQYQPDSRPSMSNVVRMMEGEQEIDTPTNPFLLMTVMNQVPPLSTEISDQLASNRVDAEEKASRNVLTVNSYPSNIHDVVIDVPSIKAAILDPLRSK